MHVYLIPLFWYIGLTEDVLMDMHVLVSRAISACYWLLVRLLYTVGKIIDTPVEVGRDNQSLIFMKELSLIFCLLFCSLGGMGWHTRTNSYRSKWYSYSVMLCPLVSIKIKHPLCIVPVLTLLCFPLLLILACSKRHWFHIEPELWNPYTTVMNVLNFVRSL